MLLAPLGFDLFPKVFRVFDRFLGLSRFLVVFACLGFLLFGFSLILPDGQECRYNGTLEALGWFRGSAEKQKLMPKGYPLEASVNSMSTL